MESTALARKIADAQFTRLDRFKRASPHPEQPLGPELVEFFTRSVARRQSKLAHIAEAWEKLVPELISRHCALEALHRGALSVLVDSAAHLYELKQLLLAGLEKQLILACQSTGLRKILLKPGQWYDGEQRDAKVKFS